MFSSGRNETIQKGVLGILFFVLISQGARLIFRFLLPENVVCNNQAAFSIALPALFLLFSIGGAFLFLALQWKGNMRHSRDSRAMIFWVIIFAGGLSNLFERLRYGCVSDYFHLIFSFNLADTLLTLGVLGLLWEEYRKKK